MDWPPKRKPKNLEFSPHRDGWAKWYRGQTRIISLKSIDRTAIRKAWDERRREIDEQLNRPAIAIMGAVTIRLAADAFYKFLDYRVKNGIPEPLADVTAADYKKYINQFGGTVGPDVPVASLGPIQFEKFAKSLEGCTPTTFARIVAYVYAFMSWCKEQGHITEIPQYGSYFVRPSQQKSRDVRISQKKSYSNEQLRLLWFHATFQEKIWIVMGLCGAMDNSDLSHLTRDVVDRKGGCIDYRRRKTGKIRRIIPLPDIGWKLLELYIRPAPIDPVFADRVFLTPTGLPLQRLKESADGLDNPIDYVSMCWTRLMIRAGLKAKIPRLHRMVNPPRQRATKARGSAAGQGFRALRTTFSNRTPLGYGDEREIIMGHAHGTVLLESYLEEYGTRRLQECVDSVWHNSMLT